MVGCGEGAIWAADFAACVAEAFEGLGGGYFVDEMSVCVGEVLLVEESGENESMSLPM